MSKILWLVTFALGALARVFFWWRGNEDAKKETAENDAEVLKKQRDNNVVSINDADREWVRLRDKDKQ